MKMINKKSSCIYIYSTLLLQCYIINFTLFIIWILLVINKFSFFVLHTLYNLLLLYYHIIITQSIHIILEQHRQTTYKGNHYSNAIRYYLLLNNKKKIIIYIFRTINKKNSEIYLVVNKITIKTENNRSTTNSPVSDMNLTKY